MDDAILGQRECKHVIALLLYRLCSMGGRRPVVLLFYGPSEVGKTESAKCLSEALSGKLARVQTSMMQTTETHDYIFGGALEGQLCE